MDRKKERHIENEVDAINKALDDMEREKREERQRKQAETPSTPPPWTPPILLG